MSDETKPESHEVREGSRIAKAMARAGLCSRREAEAWIAAGRVSVNGKTLESPAYNVSANDDVRVDGKPLSAPERTRLFLFHKPRGLVTTARDPEGRPTIFGALPEELPRLVAVGRLDINTEGLLLLTNDGGLARVLELPATGWLRRYRVRAHGAVDQPKLDALSAGVTIDGIDYAGIEAKLDREQGSNVWITMDLREGKNREIKKVLETLGLSVNRLIRVSFGPFELGDLAEGEVAEVRTRVLRDQLGSKLAREAGADFEAPIIARATPQPTPREERRDRLAGPGRERDGGAMRGRGDGQRGPRFERGEARRRRAPPAPSTPERRRKHVSALRAEIASDAAGQRKRVERSATHDRKGRTIAVERFLAAAEKPAKDAPAESSGRGRSREGGSGPQAKERAWRAGAFDPRGKHDGERRERPARAEFKARGSGTDRRGEGTGERRFDRPEGEQRAKRFEREGLRREGRNAPTLGDERRQGAGFRPHGPRSNDGRTHTHTRKNASQERHPDRPFADRSGKRPERSAPSASSASPGRPSGKGGPPKGPAGRRPRKS
jgi:23S rRNA pseudouridine2605 synthase